MRGRLPTLLLAALLTLLPGPRAIAGPTFDLDFDLVADKFLARPDALDSLLHLYQLHHLADLNPGDDRPAPLLDRLAGISGLPPEPAAHLRWLGLSRARRAGALSRQAELRAELGIPPHWMILGPFYNLGDRGFQDLPPEGGAPPHLEQLTDGEPAAGRFGPVEFHFFPEVTAAGLIPFKALFDEIGTEELYAVAATSFALTRARRLELRVSSPASVRVWLNGQLVLDRSRVRRGQALDQDVVPLQLTAGRHRLVAQVGRRADAWSLLLRLSGPGAAPPRGLVFAGGEDEIRAAFKSPAQTARLRAVGPSRPAGPLARAREAAERTEVSRDTLLTAARLERLFSAFDRSEARDVALLRRAIAKHPECAELRLELGRTLDDQHLRRDAYEAALALARDAGAPSLVAAALAQLLHHGAERGEFAAYAAHATALLELQPGHPAAELFQIERLRGLGLQGIALERAERLAAARPRHGSALRRAMEIARETEDPRREIEWAARLLERDRGDGRWLRRVLALRHRLAPDDAENAGAKYAEALDSAIARHPYDLDLRLARLRALADHVSSEAARRVLADDLERFPASPRLHDMEGELWLQCGDYAKATRAFERSLTLRPRDALSQRLRYHEKRRETQAFDGSREVAGDTHDYATARALLTKLAHEPLPPAMEDACASAGACKIMDEVRVEVRPDGLTSRDMIWAFSLRDERRRDALRRVNLPFVPGQERVEIRAALLLTPDGEVTGPTRVTTAAPGGRRHGVYTLVHQRVIQFDDLSAGDTILVHLRKIDDQPHSPHGGFFGDVHAFQLALPNVAVTYEVLMQPPEHGPPPTLHYHAEGIAPPAVSARDDGAMIYRFEAEGLPAIRMETGRPGYTEIGAYASVSTFADWQTLHDWYLDLVRAQWGLTSEMREIVASLIEGAADHEDRVRRINRWVQTSTRYVGIEFGIHSIKPYETAEVLRRGYGDCKDKSFLLVELLREAGIEAHPALVRTRNRGRFSPKPATLWAFDHMIVHLPELDLWLDPTSRFAGIEDLPLMDQGVMTLIIDPGRPAELTTTPVMPAHANKAVGETELHLERDGTGRLKMHLAHSGLFATMARRLFDDSTRRRVQLQQALARDLPGATITSYEVSDPDYRRLPLTVRLEAKIPAAAEVHEDFLRTKVVHSPLNLSAAASTSRRVHDLILDHTRLVQSRFRLLPPEGYEPPESLPEEVALETPFGSYRLTVRRDGRAVVVEREWRQDVLRVSADDYPAFRDLSRQVDRAEREAIRLVPTTPQAARALPFVTRTKGDLHF